MNCKERPQLVGEPHSIWSSQYYKNEQFTNITYNIDGTFKIFDEKKYPTRSRAKLYPQFFSAKESLNKKGYATQSDANYFAMKILEENEFISKSLVQRFPYIIIDEAQDTSDVIFIKI